MEWVQAYNVQDQGGHLKDGSLVNDSRAFFEWNTELKTMDSTTVKMPPYKFSFTAFEELSQILQTYTLLMWSAFLPPA
ncbi:hypothetical protein MKW98_027081 [Papaver atlanticum]|uniref:Uncharacterized protein n=1 Tax=Papaver atlanticum TaxID=357466 RepID=A0AAD4SAE0_9MAGN|nr:hypothetical protein MKW98_027081 [Papaver atlanticum]